MAQISSELSGSLIFNSASNIASLQPYSGGLNVSGSDLYINGVALDQRISDIESGNAGTASLRPLNRHSASVNEFTGSIDLRVDSLEAFSGSIYSFTSSIDSEVTALMAATGSYLTKTGQNVVSSSTQISASGFLTSESAAALGFGSGGDETPAGTVSSSAQILEFGFVTQSAGITNVSSSIAFTSVTNSQTSSLSSSLSDGSLIYNSDLGDLQILSGGNFHTVILDGDVVTSSSFAISSSYVDETFLSASIAAAGFQSISDGTVSSSAQITALGFLSESAAGTISSSAQIISSLPSGTVSGSAQTIANLPSGIISGSTQINITTSSITDFDTEVSRSAQAAGFGSGGGSSVDISDLNAHTSSVNTFTGSIDGEVTALMAATGAYATTGSNTFTGSQFFTGSLLPESDGLNNGIYDLGELSNPWRDLYLTTASLKFVRDGQLVSQISGEPDAIRVGNILITTSSISVVSGSGDQLTIVQNVVSASVSSSGEVETVDQVLAPEGTVSGSQQITDQGFISESALIDYDGNRIVSNEDLTGLFSASFNAGTSGSLADFINAVFFPNTPPSITTGNQTVAEFTASGSTVTTITGTDPEGQALTFGTSSAYTDDFVRVASNGVMTLNIKASGSMNTTDRGDGTLAHPVILRAVDTFDSATTKTIYLTVNENTAPQFREVSITGNVITSFTADRNENDSEGLVGTIYFTDAESDTITIQSQSDDNHFLLTRTGSYVRLLQNTSSLDYETKTSYTLALTASDEHYQSSEDLDAITTLPITVNVTDNIAPTFNNQTVTGISESAASGTSAGSATATDPESDTITFVTFTLAKLENDGSNVALSTYGGTGAGDPTEDPFTMASNGNITLDAGAFLNSDLIDTYIYSASVSDPYNTHRNAVITIPVADDAAPTLNGNTTLYVIESATSGNGVKTNSDGYSGNNARFTSNQSVTWTISSSNDFSIDSSGYVTLARNISGSSDQGGDQLNGSVTASNSFGTATSTSFTVNVTDNSAPTITFTNTTANLNTNGARSGSTVVTVSFADSEGDNVDMDSFTFTDPSGQLNHIQAGGTFRIQPNNELSASSYGITASVADIHSFETRTSTHDFTISQAGIGSLTTNGTFRIIESAESGSEIKINANGRTGTQADLGVTYSPQYNSAAVQSFTSSNASIAVNNNGNLSIAVDISGSATSSGDTITSDITFRDQYDNIGSGSITVNVVANNAPSATFTDQTSNLTASVASGSHLVTVTITDDENDTPFSMSIGGTDADKIVAIPQNSNSSSYHLQNNTALAQGTFNYSASIFDNFDKSASFDRDLTVAAQPYLVYAYGYDGGSPSSEPAAFGTLGDVGGDGTGITSASVIAMFESGALGTTFTDAYINGDCELIASSSLSTLSNTSGTSTGLASLGYLNFTSDAQIALFLFPSASVVGDKPKTMYNGTLPDSTGTALEYALYAKDTAIPGVSSTAIYYFDTEEPHLGYSNWGMILQTGQNNNNTRYYLMPDSASAP